MKTCIFSLAILSAALVMGSAAPATPAATGRHPDSKSWPELFKPDLSNAIYPEGVWTVEDGVFTASEDQALWSDKDYENFLLDLEFKTAAGSNSGVILYCSDMKDWIPNSVEIQIADDHAQQWAESPKSWQCGAFFGHQGPIQSAVRQPGEWNRMTLVARGPLITIVLNGRMVNRIDLRQFTSAKTNPDGSEVPAWLSKAPSTLPTRGRLGFQGKHAGAPIYFRNIRLRELP